MTVVADGEREPRQAHQRSFRLERPVEGPLPRVRVFTLAPLGFFITSIALPT